MRRRVFIQACTAPACLGLAVSQAESSDKVALLPPPNAPGVKAFGAGRFAIELPSHFQMLPNASIVWTVGKSSDFYRIELRTLRNAGNMPTFEELVAKRTDELRGRHHFAAPSQSMLALTRKLRDEAGSPVFVRSYSNARSTEALTCEIFVQRGETVAVLSRKIFASGPPLKPEDVESQLADIATRMQAMDPASEKEPGLGLGSLLINASFDGEEVSTAWRSTLWPEVLVSVQTRSLLEELDGGLLKRVDQNSALLAKMGFRSKTLRRGSTTLAGAPAEELLESGKDRDKTVRSFMAEVLLKQAATQARPLLTLNMKMGGQVGHEYVEPQLAEADALVLWDRVKNSLRLRTRAV